MVKHRSHSAAFKHLVAQEYLAGDSVTELANRHGVSRHLVRIWVAKLEPAHSTTTFARPS